MERFKSFLRNRWTIAGIVVILVAAAVTTSVLVFTSRDYMTIRALDPNDITQHRVRDYRNSKLWLHDNGTFAIQIILTQNDEDTPILIGIGTFSRSGRTYTFTYTDLFRRITIGGNTVFRRDEVTLLERPTFTFRRSNRRLEFRCPNYRSYFFR